MYTRHIQRISISLRTWLQIRSWVRCNLRTFIPRPCILLRQYWLFAMACRNFRLYVLWRWRRILWSTHDAQARRRFVLFVALNFGQSVSVFICNFFESFICCTRTAGKAYTDIYHMGRAQSDQAPSRKTKLWESKKTKQHRKNTNFFVNRNTSLNTVFS